MSQSCDLNYFIRYDFGLVLYKKIFHTFTLHTFSEFCGEINRDLDISEDEIPKGDCFDFMLAPATKPKEEDKEEGAGATEEKKTTPGVIVYCMDISSSMQTLCAIPQSQGLFHYMCH